MSWRVGLSAAVVAIVSVAAVVIALASTSGFDGAERVKGAIQWPPSCGDPLITRPSRDPMVQKWARYAVQSAVVSCGAGGPHVDYVKFRDTRARDDAVIAGLPRTRVCLTGAAAVIDNLAAQDITVFSDMCRALGGTIAGTAS